MRVACYSYYCLDGSYIPDRRGYSVPLVGQIVLITVPFYFWFGRGLVGALFFNDRDRRASCLKLRDWSGGGKGLCHLG